MASQKKRNTSKFIAVDAMCYKQIIAMKKNFEKKGIRLTIGATVAVLFAKNPIE